MTTPYLDRSRAKSPTGEERRVVGRQKSVADVWADPGGMEPAIPCRLLDISLIGAKLSLDAGVQLPDSFILHAGGVKTMARVIWRRQNMLGVEFEKGAMRARDGSRLPPPDRKA